MSAVTSVAKVPVFILPGPCRKLENVVLDRDPVDICTTPAVYVSKADQDAGTCQPEAYQALLQAAQSVALAVSGPISLHHGQITLLEGSAAMAPVPRHQAEWLVNTLSQSTVDELGGQGRLIQHYQLDGVPYTVYRIRGEGHGSSVLSSDDGQTSVRVDLFSPQERPSHYRVRVNSTEHNVPFQYDTGVVYAEEGCRIGHDAFELFARLGPKTDD